MSYGAELATVTGASLFRGQKLERCQACRSAGRADNEVRAVIDLKRRSRSGLIIPQSMLYRADKVIK